MAECTFADSHKLAACMSYLRSTKLGINQLVPSHQGYAQLSWHNPSAGLDCHIVAFADVVDVHRNGCISANAVLLHVGNELAFCQVVWR